MPDRDSDQIYKDLQKEGEWFWLKSMKDLVGEDELIKSLEDSYDDFIDLIMNSSQEKLVESFSYGQGTLTTSLGVKHAMLAMDISAEFIDRVKTYIQVKGIKTLTLTKEDGSTASYELKSLGRTFTQKLDNKAIQKVDENDDVLKDLLFILCHGSKIEEFKKYDTFGRCKLGEFAGNESKLKDFLSKQYINVSRQTTGKTSVDLGSIAQRHVRNKIETYFSNNNRVSFEPGNRIPGFSVEDPEVDTQFDIVLRVQKTRQATTFVAIEVAFQETTNSVIERKARQALARFREIENRNYYILYVIDGGGWFARKNSIKKILDNSHLSVSISDNDIVKLCKYVEDIVQ